MIIFIHGEDSFRSRQHLNNLKNKYLKEVDSFGSNLAIIDGAKTNLGEINNAVSTVSLLVRKRMIIIENLLSNKDDSQLEQIGTFLRKDSLGDSDSNIILLWDHVTDKERLAKTKADLKKFLAETKYSPKPFNKLSNTETKNWIIKEFQTRDSKIAHDAAELLCIYTNNDLWQINNEIDKLIHYKYKEAIHIDDIKKMVDPPITENIFGLTDAIGNKNIPLAINLFENQLEAGSNEFEVLSMINRQFKTLFRIKTNIEEGLSQRQIITLTKIHSFVVQKSMTQAKNFSLDYLKKVINDLIEIDYQAKTGKGDVKGMLETLIVRM
ncbi:MAG: DNA polymerase III subunit delta [Candidatus Falkowbacteria bacterium]|nr:DNA polymerase III subunit delta [Candidatus Falkowbacteria bacterium]